MTHPEAEPVLREHDWTIAERIEQIEFMLRFITDRDYRRQLVKEYCELTTDPEERR